MKTSLRDEFYEWLDSCPVQWFLIKGDGNDISETKK